jgi:hypothetical protein
VLPTTTTLTLLSTAAYAALAVAGAVLWRRTRSLRTVMVAIGFALVLPDQVSKLVEYFEFTALLQGRSGDTFFLIHHHAVLHYVSILGLCVAAVGLLWHALASPNNRWRGP